MGECKCGCGNTSNGRNFLPGHDQKLRASLENQVGGLLALKELVQTASKYFDAETSMEEFENVVRRIFADRNRY